MLIVNLDDLKKESKKIILNMRSRKRQIFIYSPILNIEKLITPGVYNLWILNHYKKMDTKQ